MLGTVERLNRMGFVMFFRRSRVFIVNTRYLGLYISDDANFAFSGFHSLISSGTTPKLLANEADARFIGYGAMAMESFVAIMAMIAACTLDPGVYLSMNVKGAGATPEAVAADTVAKVEKSGFTVLAPDPAAAGKFTHIPVTVSAAQMDGLAMVKAARAAKVATPMLFLTTLSGVDDRVAAVISSCGWGHGERKFQGQHPGPDPAIGAGVVVDDHRRAEHQAR